MFNYLPLYLIFWWFFYPFLSFFMKVIVQWYLCLSIYHLNPVYMCLFIGLTICITTYHSVYRSVYLSILLCIYLPNYLLIQLHNKSAKFLSIYRSKWLLYGPNSNLFFYLSIWLAEYLFFMYFLTYVTKNVFVSINLFYVSVLYQWNYRSRNIPAYLFNYQFNFLSLINL